MRGGKFSDAEMTSIDAAWRAKTLARCPIDLKPVLTAPWGKMVYFVCRACGRIGAVSYESADPSVPGVIAHQSRPSRPPPPR